jgi:GNAT superfamily N-acetyltransferase
MQSTLVAAGPADLPRLLPLLEGFYREQGFRFHDDVRHALARLLSDASLGRVLLLVNAGQVAGYIAVCFGFSIEFCGRDACLDELYVVPSHRGRGLGRRLVEGALEDARAHGARMAYLEDAGTGERALRIYRAAGFEERPHRLLIKRLTG